MTIETTTDITPTFDLIIAYEQGELDDDAVIDLFQRLVDNGLAWQLQGSYGRQAMDTIEAGLVSAPMIAAHSQRPDLLN